jgi:hypothetical protein
MLARRADAPDEPSLRGIVREVTGKGKKPPFSKNTVGRRLHEHGTDAYRKTPKPLLTKKQKAARLQWARKHANWTVEQWRRVVWSDESMFMRIPKAPRKFVWIRKEARNLLKKRAIPDKLVAPKLRGGGGKINVWGCFYAGGVGYLKEVIGNMDAAQYHQILVHHALPFINQHAQAEPTTIAWIFQQDNCSTHTAKRNVEYLERKARESKAKWTVIEWPSNSPDLNPIENIWAYLKEQLRHYKVKPSSTIELLARVRVEWENLDPELLEKYANSLPSRIAAVIESKGGSIAW